LILKSSGDLSTESVQFQATKLSCVSKKGMMFERKVNGFIADNKDSNFGVRGELLSKQGGVARTALVSSIVERASSLITGTKNDTSAVLASGGGEAATTVANWYLKQAQSLLPTIRVGSGQDVWVVMADKVNLPSEYFKKRRKGNASIYSTILN
jgi:conjugal transfer pilus assembly protein TraB